MTRFQKLIAEGVGTAALLVTVVGSGIMADALSSDDTVALLGNAMATGAMLYVLITLLGPISGAHFNPAVTLVCVLRKDLSMIDGALYVLVQTLSAGLGVIAAHAMFDLDLVQWSQTARTGLPQWGSEILATFGLVFTILMGLRTRPEAIPTLVGLYITAAYFFTSSTSFANPAVTLGRTLTNTFSGIDPAHAIAFILSQLIGAILAFGLVTLMREKN